MIPSKGFPHPLKFLQRSLHAAHAPKVPDAGFEITGRVLGCRTDFVCHELIEQVVAPMEHTPVWTEGFVL